MKPRIKSWIEAVAIIALALMCGRYMQGSAASFGVAAPATDVIVAND